MRLEEIRAERANLAKELEGDVTADRLAEIEARIAELETEERELMERAEKTAEVRRSLIGSEEKAPADDVEQRAAEVKATGRAVMDAAEVRSTLIATDSLAKPTLVGTDQGQSGRHVFSYRHGSC